MKTAIHVLDPHCRSCVLKVEALKERLPGSTRVEADCHARTVEVSFDENLLSARQIDIAPQTLGFHPGASIPLPGTTQATLPISGLRCSSCARLIESDLRKMAGVATASMNLGSGRLLVGFDPGVVDLRTILLRIRQIGYRVPTSRIELATLGLRKPTDGDGLERLLAGPEGVLSARVAPESGQIALEFIPGLASLSELAGLVRGAGLHLVQYEEEAADDSSEFEMPAPDLREQLNLLLVGLVFTVPPVHFSMARDFGLAGFPRDQFAMLVPAAVVQFLVGWPCYQGAGEVAPPLPA